MALEKSYLFVSYAREDLDRIKPLLEATAEGREQNRRTEIVLRRDAG